MFKKIILATLLLETVNCYQTEDESYFYPNSYYQGPIKKQKSSLARQTIDSLSSGGAALIGVVSSTVCS